MREAAQAEEAVSRAVGNAFAVSTTGQCHGRKHQDLEILCGDKDDYIRERAIGLSEKRK